MLNQSLLTAETEFMPRVARRVYCAQDAHLKLADGTPLHLEWVIEGTDGQLYTVRSEVGGWLSRTPFRGDLDAMRLVSSEKAEAIMWLTYADTGNADGESTRDGNGYPARCRDSLERWAY